MSQEETENSSVVQGLSADEQYKLYTALYAQYGHPTMEWLKAVFAWTVTLISAFVALKTESSVLGPAFVALAICVAVAYIIKPTGS